MQNFREMYTEGRSFLEFPKISVQIRICAEFFENVCRIHNLAVTDSNQSNLKLVYIQRMSILILVLVLFTERLHKLSFLKTFFKNSAQFLICTVIFENSKELLPLADILRKFCIYFDFYRYFAEILLSIFPHKFCRVRTTEILQNFRTFFFLGDIDALMIYLASLKTKYL